MYTLPSTFQKLCRILRGRLLHMNVWIHLWQVEHCWHLWSRLGPWGRVLMGLALLFEKQVNGMHKTAFFQLHLIHQLFPYLCLTDQTMLIHAFVLHVWATVTCCMLAALEDYPVIAAGSEWSVVREHILPVLKQHHWMPVYLQFKVLAMTVKALHGLGPRCLKDNLSLYISMFQLWSLAWHLLYAPLLKVDHLSFTRAHGFSVIASTI